MKDLFERVRKQLDQLVPASQRNLSAESFVACLLGFTLVTLSWKEFTPQQPVLDSELQALQQQIANLTDNLLKPLTAARVAGPDQDKRS